MKLNFANLNIGDRIYRPEYFIDRYDVVGIEIVNGIKIARLRSVVTFYDRKKYGYVHHDLREGQTEGFYQA